MLIVRRQDKSYWKWYRFALESQDVLVFGAIPGDAIYASIPLAQILPKLPSYFFKEDSSIPKTIDVPLETGEEDPRSPSSRRPRSPNASLLQHNVHHHEHQHQHHERTFSPQLLASLAWDIGTSLKPSKHTRSSSQLSSSMYTSPSKKTHTSHREFCGSLTAAFLSPTREHAARLLDATTGAVRLAECLVEPWFRAQCALTSGYPFHHDSDSDSDHEHSCGNPECLGLAGDGCALKTKSGLVEHSPDDEAKEEAANILQDLAIYIARWPAAWWYVEHSGEVDGVISGVVDMCVREAALGVGARVSLGIERELQRSVALARKSSNRSFKDTEDQREERRGRGEKRDLSKMKSKHLGAPSGSPKPWPTKGTPMGTPNHSRARSPLGMSETTSTPVLAPALELKTKSELQKERKSTRDESDNDSLSSKSSGSLRRQGTPPASVILGHAHSTTAAGRASPSPHIKWSETLSTPPPTPPRTISSGSLHSGRRSPPPPPPARSRKRLSFPGSSSSPTPSSSPLPTPRTSPASSLRVKESPIKSVLDRGDALPGGWPGSDSEAEAEEGEHHEDDRGDVIVKRPRHRPFSWAGTALGTMGALGLGIPSFEKDDPMGSVSGDSRPRVRTRTLSNGALKQSALQEAVETILRSRTSESPSPKEELSSGTSPLLREEPEKAVESPPRAEMGLVRRSSSSSLLERRTELSPVREDPGEDEAEVGSGTKTGQAPLAVAIGAPSLPVKNEIGADGTTAVPVLDTVPIINVLAPEVGTIPSIPSIEALSIPPLSSPKHERSRTLESIPEEEKEELSAVSPKLTTVQHKPWDEDVASSGDKELEGTSPQPVLASSPATDDGVQPIDIQKDEHAPVLKRDVSVWTEEDAETSELESAVTKVLKPDPLSSTSSEQTDTGIDGQKEYSSDVRAQNEKLYNALLPLAHSEESINEKTDAVHDADIDSRPKENTVPHIPLPLNRTPTGFGWLRRRLSRISSTINLSASGSPLSASSPIFEDDANNFSLLRTSSWAASCLLCGIIVTAFIITDRRQSVIIGNRYC